AVPPSARITATLAWPRSAFRPTTATRAPAAASPCARAPPSTPVAPITTATSPVRSNSFIDAPTMIRGAVQKKPRISRRPSRQPSNPTRRAAIPRHSPHVPLRAIHRVGIVLLLAVLSARATPPAEPGESWALSALARPGVPAHLADHPIDAFVRAALIEQGRDILPPAEPRQLVRRLHVDLHGLLPTSDEVREFGSGDPRSIAITVTRLLASPHYGERWARHWLDVVGYAETHGHDQDRPRESAWPYRDYVIDAFNADKPYARFVMEQVAADALFPDHPELTPALGFLAAGPWDESSLRDIREDTLDREIGRYLDRDEILANVFSTFTATT